MQQKTFTFISGATGGLGKAFAVECAKRGENLFLTSTKEDKLKVLAEALSGLYCISVEYKKCNMADESSRDELVQHLSQNNFKFDKLINTAGIDFEGEFLTLEPAKIRSLIRVNVESIIETTYSVLKLRDEERDFKIITVSSLAGYFPMPFKALYAASKRMLNNFFLAIGRELRGEGVSITLLCPAGIPTNPEWTRSIESQGFVAELSTVNVGKVVYRTLKQADKGKRMYVPGFINKIAGFLGKITPTRVMNNVIYSRWKKTRTKAERISIREN